MEENEVTWRIYRVACIILTTSHQTMTYSSISYSSRIPIPSPKPRSGPLEHDPASPPTADLSLRATIVDSLATAADVLRELLVTVNQRTLTAHGIQI